MTHRRKAKLEAKETMHQHALMRLVAELKGSQSRLTRELNQLSEYVEALEWDMAENEEAEHHEA